MVERARDPQAGAEVLAAEAEAAVADVERRLPLGIGPIERVEAARIRQAARRLRECATQLTTEELVVSGSMGQRRPHPLLKVEQDLRREIDEGVQRLVFRAEQRAMLERYAPRSNPAAAAADGEGG